MKKILAISTFTILSLGFAITAFAQSSVSVNTRPGGLKSVSKGRTVAITNTLSPLALGLATVSISENNTLETAGAALGVYGLIVGPSTGNFYAGDYQRGGLGMAVRGIGAFLMADATREIFGNDFADALTIDDKEVSLTDTKILIGEVLVVGSMIYNIITVQNSVQQYNRSTGRFSLNLDSERIQDKVAPVLSATIPL